MTSNLDRFLDDRTDGGNPADKPFVPSSVRDLSRLVEAGAKYSTVYADPPWPYSNTAARGAAENHYRTMTLEAIRSESVKLLAAEDAHLHLWTTNAFLREAFDVIREWGFKYTLCLVWVQPQIGMGNYWRVSHEYLLLGVRGNLPFHDQLLRLLFTLICGPLRIGRSIATCKASGSPFSQRRLLARVDTIRERRLASRNARARFGPYLDSASRYF